jgi:D-amino-acid dehydrogenase
VRENCPARAVASDGDRAIALSTRHGPVSAGAFVFATGAWTPLLNEQLGCRVPIQPGKGYSITMPRPSLCPQVPMVFEEHRVAVTPMETGYRLGSMMEFAGYDTSLDPRRLDLLRNPTEEEWYGWRPMTPDSVPIIDRSPKYTNVWIAAGHNMLGVSMAPATGKLIAELLSGEAPHIDPAPYALKRFHV